MKIRIATRQSPLALVQSEQVKQELLAKHPDLEIELMPIVTTGDKVQNHTLAQMGGKGLFVKCLEEALLENKADIAVHSLKDVPPHLDSTFCLAAVLKRHSPFDALVSLHYPTLESLPEGAIVGTCSVRRKAALLNIRPDLTIKMIRGNVGSRLKKLDAREYDALVLAEAGLTRLGLKERIQQILPLEIFVPSVGQGVIAIESLAQREDLRKLLQTFNDTETQACITAERSMNHRLNARCTSPVGSFAQCTQGQLQLTGVVWSEDGQTKIQTQQSGSLEEAEAIGHRAALHLLASGASFLLQNGSV